MPHLFGRPVPSPPHKICDDLAELATDGNSGHRAMGNNLAIDDRVSEQRAGQFLSRRGSGTFKDALVKSKWGSAVEMSHPLMNKENIVFSPSLGIINRNLNGDTELVRIQPLEDEHLKALRKLIPEEEGEDDIGSARSSAKRDDNRLAEEWLERHSGQGFGKLPYDFRATLTTALNIVHSPKLTFPFDHVAWAGLETEFRPHAARGARRWLEVFGMGHLLYKSSSAWYVALKYRLSDVSVAARPCVLEAGESPWHHPSPASLPATQGGKTLVLGQARADGVRPMTEFVHLNRIIRPDDIAAVSLFTSDSSGGSEQELENARNSR